MKKKKEIFQKCKKITEIVSEITHSKGISNKFSGT